LATAQAQAQSNKPITLNIMPDLSLILQRGSGLSDVVVTRDSLIAALEAATNGNHSERIYVRSAKGVRLEDLVALAIAAGSAGYKIAMVLESDVTCKSYLAMSEHDTETFANILKFGETLRYYCQGHPTHTLQDALIELRRGMKADDTSVCKQAAGDEAIAACTRLLALNPQDAVAYTNRGGAYGRRGEYDRAIADLDQATRLDPKYAAAYTNRGFAYEKKGDHSRASADYDHAMKLNPAAPRLDSARGTPDSQRGAVVQGDDASLTALLRRHLYGCWSPPVGLSDAKNLVVRVTFSLNRDGSLSGAPQVKPTASGPLFLAAAESAVRAIRMYTPLKLPADKYESWKEIEAAFDPRMMQ
jgi:tetratricopeptide (TPR) repeat protein